MSYKKRIDEARKRQELYRDNLTLIASDIAAKKSQRFDFSGNTPSIVALTDEYNLYVQLYNLEERLISELQPWYRKVFGREY
jgi:hypothetical protein